MLSTLSTVLNKSDEFIKDNAVNTYVHTIKFNNDTKVHLTEVTSIPVSEIPVRSYVRCSTFLYPNDIQICRFTLTFSVTHSVNNDVDVMQMRNITPIDIDTGGLLPGIREKLNKIGICIDALYQNGFYNGCRFTVHSPRMLAQMECNYAFAWMFGIMVSFGNNSSTDMLTLYQIDMSTLHPSIDCIGFKGNSRNSTNRFSP